MPLYIDIHTFVGPLTIDDVKKAHTADKAVQDRYGVTYHQFWVNEDSGMVFCLAEGPDMETVEKVHQTAHGNLPCNMVEVEPGFFKLLMGDGQPIDHGLVQNGDGTADPAYRHLMYVDLQSRNLRTMGDPPPELNVGRNLVLERIVRYKGRVIEQVDTEALVGVFDTATNAVRCAKVLQNDLGEFSHSDGQLIFRLGLCTGFPLTPTGQFFSDALKMARRLCATAPDMSAIVSSLMAQVCSLEEIAPLKSLSNSEEAFLLGMLDHIDKNLSDQNFNVDQMGRALSVSRAQLYRKTVSITGRSPKDFIFALRMAHALTLMKKRFGNISEIAFEVGYSSPSYFSKCFQRHFGCAPSSFMRKNPTPNK